MARSWFAGTGNEMPIILGPNYELILRPIWPLLVWDAETGGSQHTDLLLDGNPVDEIPPPRDGWYERFQGPDGVNDWVWAEVNGGPRFLLMAQNIAPPKITVASSAPASPEVDDVWIDTT